MPVQLTRIEGDIKLILFQVTDVSTRMGHAEANIDVLQAGQQKLFSDAAGREATEAAKQQVLKDAKEEQENKSNQAWSPFARIILVVNVVLGIFFAYLASRRT